MALRSNCSRKTKAIAEADMVLVTAPNQLGDDYNAHIIEAILETVGAGLDRR